MDIRRQLPRRRNSTLKKIFAILLSTLFVLSYAASAFAIHAEIPSDTQAVIGAGTTQITLGGDLRVRGWYFDNVDSSRRPDNVNSAAYYDERVRLSVDAKVTPNVEGMVQLESDTAPGSGSSSDKFYWGNFNSKPAGLSILQAWIMYSGSGLFGIPAGVKIGHMPLALGNGVFFDHTHFGDDAIVLFANPTKDIEADLLTIKFGGDGSLYQVPTFGIKELSATPTPASLTNSAFNNSDDLDGYVGIVTYKIDDKNTIGLNYTYLNLSSLDFDHQNLELAGKGNISGLGYNYSGDVQFGHVGSGAGKVDFRGYAAMAGVNYQIDPVNVRASFAYGSGDNNASDGKDKQFETYLGDDQHFTLIYDYGLNTAAGGPGGSRRDSGISNTTYYNLGFDVNPAKDLKASLDGYILRASEPTFAGQSKNVGWEIDGRVKYQIAKNLTYQVDAGYMHAGSFYGDAARTGNLGYTAGTGVKNPVVLRHLIELSF
jgi:Alginate export